MSRYHSSSQYAPSAAPGPAQDSASATAASPRADARHDRDDSLSDSETSTSFNAYSDTIKDADAIAAQDDPYLALTSQTLNADGTPKRPMNAFMIFARKRRPQISAANQMMRTGEVSKILSKEWNSMDMSEKKFYLDQAKKLKDNFNSKYPDYVYRRRPNNSRKKRKPDAASHDDAADGVPHLADPDDPAYGDDTSPIDPDDALMIPSPQEVQYTRPHPHALSPSSMYHPHDASAGISGPPPCTYPYTSDFHAGAHGALAGMHHAHAHPARLAHLPPEAALPGTTVGAVRPSPLHDAAGYGAPPSAHSLYQNAGHASAMYGAPGAPGLWDPATQARAGARSEHQPGSRSNWPVLPALDISLARQRSYPSAALGSAPNGKTDPSTAYSPQLPARPWSSATSSTASSSSSASTSHYGSGGGGGSGSGGGGGQQSANAFPTLSSAFFPPGESPGGAKGNTTIDVGSPASASASASAHDYYPSSAGPGRRGSTGQDAGYAASQYSQQQQQQQQHHQQQQHAWSQHFSRTGAGQHQHQHQHQQQRMSAAGLHSISTYSLQPSPGGEGSSRSTSGSSAHSTAAPLGFWDNRFGGR
ncbi:hypothetical protein C8Q73DRAFT_669455 [Cubamyces lactineus]|nr:hypothetical protein C8Q73DRAFT_669455 [Cubamyces lactineus]